MLPLGRWRRDRMADPPAVNAHHVAWSHRWPRSCRTGDNPVPSNQHQIGHTSFDHLFEIGHTPILGVPWPPVAPPHRPARLPRSSTTRSRRSDRRPAPGSSVVRRRRRRPSATAGRPSPPASTRSSTRRPAAARPSPRSCGASTGCAAEPRPAAATRPTGRPGPLRLAAQGADLRRRAQPARAAGRDRLAAARLRRAGCRDQRRRRGPATPQPRAPPARRDARPTS